MLNVRQRLIALYILHEVYPNEASPFCRLVLHLLVQPSTLHPAERRLLAALVKGGAKVGKLTPAMFIKETENEPAEKLDIDLESYRKTMLESLPKTNLVESASLFPVVCDCEGRQGSTTTPALDPDELFFRELTPEMLRPLPPACDESYLLASVFR